ncbi:MAG TPA: hypothetical protein VE090_02665 [Methylomirabilota bacterium]|nr:hypothetical protein [Methylomirabilota bacterium]
MIGAMQDGNVPQSYFPNNLRFITEHPWFSRSTLFTKLLFASFISGIILIGIVLQGFMLQQNLQKGQEINQERLKLTQELIYWQNTAKHYTNYRDIYFRIATLQYEIGNNEAARDSLQKVLSLDPNFKEGQLLGEKINKH